MGTYADSVYRIAATAHVCERCEAAIVKGERYLAYAIGLRRQVAVCLACSLTRGARAGSLLYPCAAAELEANRAIGQPGRARVSAPHSSPHSSPTSARRSRR